MNYFKTFILIGAMSALFTIIGYALGGQQGAFIALGFSFILNFVTYWKSDSLVLKMTKAELADPIKDKYFYDITKDLTVKANLPMPKLYIMHNDMPNAFATGRNPSNSAVAVTTGIVKLLSKNELAGVIAHELAHIKNHDTLISTIAASIASAISMIANIFMFASLFGGNRDNRPHPIVSILVMIVAPLAATVIQMAISRNREYAADKMGGEIIGNPIYLAKALRKLENYNKQKTHPDVNPSTAHLFIINPLRSNQHHEATDNLFSTHPHTANRVKALEKLALAMGIPLAIQEDDILTTDCTLNDNQSNNGNPWKESTAISSKKPSDYNTPNNPWK